jgi:hypothetical protein
MPASLVTAINWNPSDMRLCGFGVDHVNAGGNAALRGRFLNMLQAIDKLLVITLKDPATAHRLVEIVGADENDIDARNARI